MRTLMLCCFFGLACSSEPPAGCTPGASAACSCSDGSQGAQVCSTDHTFDACVCDPGRSTTGGTTGGGTTGGTTGGSGDDKRVFVTSTTYGIAAIGKACQQSADAAGLGGTFKPWLSTSTVDAIDAIKGDGPWVRLDGKVAFKNHAQLATQPSVPLNITEEGAALSADYAVWTGTTNGGVFATNCEDWSIGSYAVVGYPHSTEHWTDYNTTGCSGLNNLYCFEQ